jgi:RNA polymerase sigma-70 factor (ECF subfamily)
LAFVERRVHDRALAEDIVQEAFARGIDRIGQLESTESARAWFYRMLRNAIIDQARRRAAAARALEALADELGDESDRGSDEAYRAVCACVARVATTLKPEYADALRRVEIDGASMKEFAAEAGITPANAAVRVSRARAALKKLVTASCGVCAEHGCVDCDCRR